jgi:hypothetical protein
LRDSCCKVFFSGSVNSTAHFTGRQAGRMRLPLRPAILKFVYSTHLNAKTHDRSYVGKNKGLHPVGALCLSAANLANVLGLQQQDLATLAGVHRNTLRTHPESPKLQSTLRDLVRVLSAAMAVQPDFERALFLVKNQPIPTFRHKTILQLLQDGRTEDAIDYLESISAGFVG